MSRFAWIVVLAVFAAAPSAAQTPVPDLRGIWKGESESIVLGSEHPHHASPRLNEPEFRSVAFTLSVDKQEGRRFSGTFSSARRASRVIAVISHNGTILLADNEGHSYGTMLAPNRMELCYLHVSSATRIASCVVLTKQR
jgi:hypothetical protein